MGTGLSLSFQNGKNFEDWLHHHVLNTIEHLKVVMMVNSMLCAFYRFFFNENTRLLARRRARTLSLIASRVQTGTATLEGNLAEFLTKIKVISAFNPVIMPWIFYPPDLKAPVHTKTSTEMSVFALVVIAKNRKQTKCPLVGTWIS